ncbi:MAG: hypothetical protein COB20_12560 [SAR86 cluster bacterium]|uniref:ABM domain-containing protein n=1 Tax=SAR86 cluster bacterium TaxID=2030880 RepID=A0A2A4WZ08_9GAMM|nr:MAG: hypothetical protein COB20_12560 [SAR86 cluster bacterium]
MHLLVALSLLVTSELSIQEGKVEEFLALVHDGLEVSRSFSGNQSFNIFLDQEKPGKVLFIEQWESEQHFQKYYQWRLEQRDFETLGEYFNAPPAMHLYRALDELGGSE